MAPGSAHPPPAPRSSHEHKSDTVLCPMKKGHYLHSSTVCFNVNHISSLYSLFLQTFKNTGVQLKKTRAIHRPANLTSLARCEVSLHGVSRGQQLCGTSISGEHESQSTSERDAGDQSRERRRESGPTSQPKGTRTPWFTFLSFRGQKGVRWEFTDGTNLALKYEQC